MTELTLEGLEKALSHSLGTHTVGDVVRQILDGEAQLWEEPDALIVTEVQQTPRKRVLHFWLATGDMTAVVDLHHRILRWGREEMGCDVATLSGRKGWTKALEEHGWEPALTTLSRSLERDMNRDGGDDG